MPASMSIGVPIKVLHEAEGHIITLETTTGEVFRGKLLEAEDNMNCQMTQVHVTYRNGSTSNLELVFIRGSKIRFLILPDMLKNAPMFKRIGQKGAGIGAGARGKAAMMRGQTSRGGRSRGGPGGGRGGTSRGGSWQGGGPGGRGGRGGGGGN